MAKRTNTRRQTTKRDAPAKRKRVAKRARPVKRARATSRSRAAKRTRSAKPAPETAARRTRRTTTLRTRGAAPMLTESMAVTKEEELKAELDGAIRAFNRRRSELLQKALAEGGDAAVAQLEAQHDALRDAFFDLLKRQLDRNNERFAELTTAASSEAEKLRKAIDSLARIASVLNLFASVIGLVGRVVTVLGV